MLSSIKGVRIINKKTYSVLYIDHFSDDLKDIIRSQLTSICHGASKASKRKIRYNYKNTVGSFIKRYKSKSEALRIGMMGELLAHISILQFLKEFKIVSPLFNMEEKGITKGFDVILFSSSTNEIWITEVKSGELHKGKNSNGTNKNLLSTAKSDLKRRLNQNEETLWDNAINKATIVLENNKDTKDAVLEILEEIGDGIIEHKASSKNKNVILVTNLFANLNDEIQEQALNDFYIKTTLENLFKGLLVISIQKNTYQKIYEFLKDEAKS